MPLPPTLLSYIVTLSPCFYLRCLNSLPPRGAENPRYATEDVERPAGMIQITTGGK